MFSLLSPRDPVTARRAQDPVGALGSIDAAEKMGHEPGGDDAEPEHRDLRAQGSLL